MCGMNIRLESMFRLGGGEPTYVPPPVSPAKNLSSFMYSAIRSLKMYQIGLH